jgi:hypothetical protein
MAADRASTTLPLRPMVRSCWILEKVSDLRQPLWIISIMEVSAGQFSLH